MRSRILSLAAGSALLLGAGVTTADAMPGGVVAGGASPAEITLVSGGCGLGFHRGIYGGCRPNFFRGYGYRRFGYRRGYYRNF